MIHQLSVLVAALLLASCSPNQMPFKSVYEANNSTTNNQVQFPAVVSNPLQRTINYYSDVNGKLIPEENYHQALTDTTSHYYKLAIRNKKFPENIFRETLNRDNFSNNQGGNFRPR